MSTTTIRVEAKTREEASDLAEDLKTTIGDVVSRAVGSYRREIMLSSVNKAYAALSEDSDLWKSEMAERAAWDRLHRVPRDDHRPEESA